MKIREAMRKREELEQEKIEKEMIRIRKREF